MGSFLLDGPTSHKPGLVLAIVSRNDEVDASVDANNITDIADAHHYEIMAMETDKDHVHILLGYDTTDFRL